MMKKKLLITMMMGLVLGMGVVWDLANNDQIVIEKAEAGIKLAVIDLNPLTEGKFGLPDIVGGSKEAGAAETLVKSSLKKIFETGRILLGSVAVMFLIFGGMKLGTAQGEDGVKKAKEIILDSVMAMVLVTAAPLMIDIFFQGGSGETDKIGNQQVEEFWKGATETSASGGELAFYAQALQVIDFIMLLLIPIFIGVVIYLGAMHIFSVGDTEWVAKQRKGTIWGLAGLGIVLLAKSTVAVFLGQVDKNGILESIGNVRMGVIYEELIGVINFLLTLAGVAALVMMVWTGYQMMIAGDNKDEFEKKKKQITFITVGILVILSAYVIVNTVATGKSLV